MNFDFIIRALREFVTTANLPSVFKLESSLKTFATWVRDNAKLTGVPESDWGAHEATILEFIEIACRDIRESHIRKVPSLAHGPVSKLPQSAIQEIIGVAPGGIDNLYVDMFRAKGREALELDDKINDILFGSRTIQNWLITEYNGKWFLAYKENGKWTITRTLSVDASTYVTTLSGQNSSFRPKPFNPEDYTNPEATGWKPQETKTSAQQQQEAQNRALERIRQIARLPILFPGNKTANYNGNPVNFVRTADQVTTQFTHSVSFALGSTPRGYRATPAAITNASASLLQNALNRDAVVRQARAIAGLEIVDPPVSSHFMRGFSQTSPGTVQATGDSVFAAALLRMLQQSSSGSIFYTPSSSSRDYSGLNYTFNPLSAPTSSLLSPTTPGTSGSFLGSSFSLAGSSSYFSISPTGTGGLGIASGLGGGVANQDGIGTPSVPIGNGPVPLPEPAASSGNGGSKPPVTTTTAAPSPDDDSYNPNSGFSPEGLLGKGVDVSSLDSILDGLPESKPNEPVSPNKPDKQKDPLEIALEKALNATKISDAVKEGEVFLKYADETPGINNDREFWAKAKEITRAILEMYGDLGDSSSWKTPKNKQDEKKTEKIRRLYKLWDRANKRLESFEKSEVLEEESEKPNPAEAEVARDTEALTEAMKDAEKRENNSRPISDNGAPLEQIYPGLYWSDDEKKFHLAEEMQLAVSSIRRIPSFKEAKRDVIDLAVREGESGRFTLGLYKKHPEVLDYDAFLRHIGTLYHFAKPYLEDSPLTYKKRPSKTGKPYYGGVFDTAFAKAVCAAVIPDELLNFKAGFNKIKRTPDERFGINVEEVSEDTAKDMKERIDNANIQEGRYGYANIISRLVKLGFLSLGESGLDLAEAGRKAIEVYKTTYPEIDYDKEVSLQKEHYRAGASARGRRMQDDDVVFGFLEPYLQLQPALFKAVYSSYKDKDQNQAVLSPRSLMMNANEVASLYQDIKHFGKDGTLSADWIDKILAIEEQDPNSLKNTTIPPLTDTQAIEPLTVPQEVDSSTMKPYDGMDYKDNLFWDYIMNHVSMETRKDAYRDQLFGEISGISHKGFGNYHVWDVQGRGGIKEANEYVEQALQEGRFKDIYEETVKANPWIEKLMPESANLNLDKYKTEYARFFEPILSSLIYFQTASIKHPEGRNIKGEVIKPAEDYSEAERKTRIEYLRSLAKDGAHWAMLAEPRGKGIGADHRVTDGLEKLREERSRRLIEEAQKEVAADISNSTVPVSATETEAPSQSPTDIAVNTTASEAPNAPVPNTTSVENNDLVKALLEQERFKNLLSHNGLVYKDGEFQYEDSVVAKGFESFFKGDKEKIKPAMRGFKSILEKELPPDKAMSLLKKHTNLFRAATLQYGRNKDSKHTAEINDFIRELARATASGEAINGDEETELAETGEQSAVSPEAPAQETANKKPGILGKIRTLRKKLGERIGGLGVRLRWNREAREDRKDRQFRELKAYGLAEDGLEDAIARSSVMSRQGDISGIYSPTTTIDGKKQKREILSEDYVGAAWDSIPISVDKEGNRTADVEDFKSDLFGDNLSEIVRPIKETGKSKDVSDNLRTVLANDSGSRKLRGDRSAFENALSDARGTLQLLQRGYIGASPAFLARRLKKEGQGGRPEYVRAVTEALGLTRDSDPGANFINATMTLRDYIYAPSSQRISELADQGAASGVTVDDSRSSLWKRFKSAMGWSVPKTKTVSLSDKERTKYAREIMGQLKPFTKTETWKINGKEQQRLIFDEEGAKKAFEKGNISQAAYDYVKRHETHGASIIEKYGAQRKQDGSAWVRTTERVLNGAKNAAVALYALGASLTKLTYTQLKGFINQIDSTTRSLAGYNGKLGALEGWRQAREFRRKTRHAEQTSGARIDIADAMENVKDAWADLVAVFLNSGGGEALAKIADGFARLLEKMQPFAEWLAGFVAEIAGVPTSDGLDGKGAGDKAGNLVFTGDGVGAGISRIFGGWAGLGRWAGHKMFGDDTPIESEEDKYGDREGYRAYGEVKQDDFWERWDHYSSQGLKPGEEPGFWKTGGGLVKALFGGLAPMGKFEAENAALFNEAAEKDMKTTMGFTDVFLNKTKKNAGNGPLDVNKLNKDFFAQSEFSRLGMSEAETAEAINRAGGIDKVLSAMETVKQETEGELYGTTVKEGADMPKLLAAITMLTTVFGKDNAYLAKIKEATEKTAENTDPNKDEKGQIENQAIYKAMMNFARRSSATGGRADEFKNESWSSDSKQYGRWADAGKTYIVGGRR